MEESATQNASIALYRYLCQNIVGTKEHVKTVRMMNTVRDNLETHKSGVIITSGSFGEGLELRGSDLDIMRVISCVEVYEDTHIDFDAKKICFTMEMEDTQTGFTQLRLLHSNELGIFEECVEICGDFYFSSSVFKQRFAFDFWPILHGPCVSDEYGLFDYAFCLHSKLWITPAKQWVTRSNNSWPSYDVKQAIIKHGVLFVPIGVKGSSKVELEWRISFSVGEKLLIHTFTHTQLLCYALMKILLKDVIALDIDCKELLCSYFMKTILFWICEELPSSIWTPENLISCYMRYFRRLIYCVEYKVCPHYFISELNLFENKIQGYGQEKLLRKLYILNSYGWQCILLSDQISNFNALTFDISNASSYFNVSYVKRMLQSFMFLLDTGIAIDEFLLEKVIHKILFSKSSKVKYLYTHYFTKYWYKTESLQPINDMFGNKSTYKQYNIFISSLVLNTRNDAVSGWLMLASFFYRRKQYYTALDILQYSLLKCSPEKLYRFMSFSDIHYELFDLHLFRKMTIVQLRRLLLLDDVRLPNNMLLPAELQLNVPWILPSVVYAHFLRFLCHYHLQNSRHCWDSLQDLQLIIEENYCIGHIILKACSYNILGICFQLLGDIESARLVCLQSISLFTEKKFNSAFQMLS